MLKNKLSLLVIIALIAATAPLYAQVHGDFYPRPFPMGTSISTTPTSPFITAGTAGMRVRALWNQDLVFILSNAHVLSAAPPSFCVNTLPAYSWVLQPGTLDLGFDPGNNPTYLGALFVAAKPIDFSFGANNVVDVGVAYTVESLASSEILGIGNPTPALATATTGMAIIKSGRTTGVTSGSVTSVNSTVNVNYGGGCGTARFVQQIITTAGVGQSGDSGSVLLESATLAPVGLYFAGSAFSGIANPILSVYQSYGIFVDGAASTIRTEADLERAVRNRRVDPVLENLKTIQARHQDRIMSHREVTAMGIGISEDGKEPAFVVYTLGEPALVKSIPSRIDGVPVRLVRSGEIVAH